MAKFNFTEVITVDDLAKLQEYASSNNLCKLNLGCNADIRPGYLNIDIMDFPDLDIQSDINDLSKFIAPASVKEILAYDLLEHLPYATTSSTIKSWVDLLDKNGIIIIRVPDMEKIARKLLSGELPTFQASRLLYGGQDYPSNFHYAGFTGSYLEGLVLASGCSEILQVVREEESHNVTIVAKK